MVCEEAILEMWLCTDVGRAVVVSGLLCSVGALSCLLASHLQSEIE